MSTLDLRVFRAAAETVQKMNGHNETLDFTPVTQVSKLLEQFTRSLEGFLELDAATRCHLRSGAIRLGKKFERDDKLYHFLRGMTGNTRNVAKLDAVHLSQTRTFLEGIACM